MLVLEPLLDLVQTLNLTAERGERFSLEIKKLEPRRFSKLENAVY